MAKAVCTVLILLTINVGDYFAMGQSTIGDCNNDEQDRSYSDALFALTKSIQSEVQNLKAQVSRLEDRIEVEGTNTNVSIQQLQIENIDIRAQMRRLEDRLERQRLAGSRCPNGFNSTASVFPKCYAVLRQTANWNAAQQKCRQLHRDAHLAVINGALEQEIITNTIQNIGCLGTFRDNNGIDMRSEYYWVGGQLQNISDCGSAFVWKPDNRTSLPISYTNWYSGEPNCVMDIEKCLGIRTNGQWNDLACHWTFCSVCEVTA